MKEPIKVESVSFKELAELFKKKIFAIPEIQREFVWTKSKIINLLDSIDKHYPIGSFLVCKVPSGKTRHIRESSILPAYDNENNNECYVVIDGQQRLSVIFSLLHEKTINKTKRYNQGIDFAQIGLSSNSKSELDFGFYKYMDHAHVSLSKILNDSFNLKQHSIAKRKRIEKCKDSFDTYNFPFIFISGYNEDSMREAFIRLNKGGTALSTVDKIFALSYHKDTDIRKHCDQLLNVLPGGFGNIERENMIKGIAANLGLKDFISNNSLNTFAKNIHNPRHKLHMDYIKKRKDIYNSIILAADYLIQNIKDASYIPYPPMLPILSIFYFNNKNNLANDLQLKEIKKWFWLTGFTKRYSGANQRFNQLNDAEEMKKLAEKKSYKMNLEKKKRIEPLSLKELSRVFYTTNSAIRNSYFCYLISKSPLIFTNGDPLQISNVSSIFNTKNDHHIFPKDILRPFYYKEDINTIINICFLSFRENNNIKAKKPWEYLANYSHNGYFKKVMASLVLPHTDSLLIKGNVEEKYEEFKKERIEIIRKDLVKMMGSKYVVK